MSFQSAGRMATTYGGKTSPVMAGEKSKQAKRSVDAMVANRRADRIHKSRSAGQKTRQARERLYGKNSHIVTVTYLPGFGPGGKIA